MNLRKALSVVEYAFLIAIVVAALLGMSIYVKRSLSGRWKQEFDAVFGHGRQYEPGITVIYD
jgi:Flp pilus assembly pilin Flp